MSKSTQNSDGNSRKMPRGRPFPKGKSGNPGGRPVIPVDVRALANERTPQAMEHLWAIIEKGKGMVKLEAIRLWLAYGPGKPTDKVEHSGPDGGPIDLRSIPTDDLEAIDAILSRSSTEPPERPA
jgi:hypothetical protein